MAARRGVRAAVAQRQGQAFHLVGDQVDALVEAPEQVAGAGMAQQFDIGVAGEDGFEQVEQRDQHVDALFLQGAALAGIEGIARRLQPVGQGGMGLDQGAEGGRSLAVGIVDGGLGAQEDHEGAHRLGQQQTPRPVVGKGGGDQGIGGVEDGAAGHQDEMVQRRRAIGKVLRHGEDEGQHAGHGDVDGALAIGRDQSGPEPREGGGGQEGAVVELRRRGQGGEEDGRSQGEAQQPGLLPQRVGLVADGDADRAAGGGHGGVEPQRPAGQHPGQADPDGHRQPVFQVDPEHRQRPLPGESQHDKGDNAAPGQGQDGP